jgi:DNA-binding transcriptional MerR regulator/quercetin dioxygenase-like cupin family protein
MGKKYHQDDEVLFNINQVAKVLNVVPTTIRNWEKAGLFTAKRKGNNYRVFNLDDLELLKKIKTLSVENKMGARAIKSILMTEVIKPPYLTNQGGDTQSKYSKKLISNKWREAREKMGLTLDEVSAQVDISSSYLSKIENGLANISIDILNKLAIFYGESILSFFELEGEDDKVVRKGCGEIAEIGISGVEMESLISQKHHVLFPMLFTIEPGGGDPNTHRHHGEEFIYVLNGRLKVTLNYDEEYTLKQGDSIYFRSFDYHSWINDSVKATKVIWVHSPVEAQPPSL